MSSQPIPYTSAQIAELTLLETVHLQAQITSPNYESFLRVLLMREAHTCSERRADAAMQWTQKRADALNEVVMSAVRDEAETRKSNMDIKSGAECYSEDTLTETRNAVYLKE
ncbi:uncharacterized protein RAG0_07974 [Rhynchosporium agropyri]|uniref:Uncharacterized protein n=1 Tax=Rhynchosporium agropyri TaxID=914238 RepID=A0A1E1KNQ9_9HELO|nr:uncharacterized protein RAG0_07974 [Rhynchosporium agropyri]